MISGASVVVVGNVQIVVVPVVGMVMNGQVPTIGSGTLLVPSAPLSMTALAQVFASAADRSSRFLQPAMTEDRAADIRHGQAAADTDTQTRASTSTRGPLIP